MNRNLIVIGLFLIAAVLSWRAVTGNRERRELEFVESQLDAELRSKRPVAEDQAEWDEQLAQLEKALGVRLFERDRRRVLLTAAGRVLVERARAVLRETGDLVEAATRAGDPLNGRQQIGVIPTISPYLLPTAAPALRRAHPRLTVVWREEKTADLVRDLQSGTLDAALLALEADIGDWTGEELKKVARLPEWRTVQRHPSGFRFPGGESFVELQARIVGTIERLVAAHPGGTIVAVSHADTIKAAVVHATGAHLDMFQRITISPASITAVAYGELGPMVLHQNWVPQPLAAKPS